MAHIIDIALDMPRSRTVDVRTSPNFNDEAGFTLFELFVVVALLSILAITSIGLIEVYKKRTFDTVAASDYRHIKTAIIDEVANSEIATAYSITDLTGPTELPAPLAPAQLSKKVELTRAERETSETNQEILRLEIFHQLGNFLYRYVSVDDVVLEQVIEQ